MLDTGASALSPSDGPSRVRVGIDFHTFGGIFQGVRSHILGLYPEAIALAPDIDFVFFVGEPEELRRAHPAFSSANATCVTMPHAGGLKRLGWQLAELRRRHRIDLLHLQYRLPVVALGPCACTVHDTLYETHPQYFAPAFARMSRFTGRRAVRDSALVFTVSEFARGEMARLYGLDRQRIAVTANGVDHETFYPGEEGAEQVRSLGLVPGGYLCTVGRLEPRKNHVNLLRAYAMLPAPRPPLVIVGQRDFRSRPIFETVRQLGLGDEVRFMDKVPDRGLPALLRHAKVFVYPSFAEGFGMPVIEAMASGVPVVTSNTTSLPEVAGDAAVMVDPSDHSAIARAIALLLGDEQSRRRAAEKGVRQAQGFSWRTSASVLVGEYRRYFSVVRNLPKDTAH